MLSRSEYIRQSLETHLFFGRIMKEHAFFLQVGFTPRNDRFIRQANELRMAFADFLEDCVAVASGVISKPVIESGEIVTKYTLEAEKLTQFYTGVSFRTGITQAEEALIAGNDFNPSLERKVFVLNKRALRLIDSIIKFKTNGPSWKRARRKSPG